MELLFLSDACAQLPLADPGLASLRFCVHACRYDLRPRLVALASGGGEEALMVQQQAKALLKAISLNMVL